MTCVHFIHFVVSDAPTQKWTWFRVCGLAMGNRFPDDDCNNQAVDQLPRTRISREGVSPAFQHSEPPFARNCRQIYVLEVVSPAFQSLEVELEDISSAFQRPEQPFARNCRHICVPENVSPAFQSLEVELAR